MRYKVSALGRIVEGCMFSIFADGRQNAAKTAAEELRTRYKDMSFKTEKCTRTNIIVIGEDQMGDMVMRAFVAPFPEPED